MSYGRPEMRVGLLTLLVTGLAFSLVGALYANTWKLFEMTEWEYPSVGGSGTWRWEPLLTESWATGTTHGSGILIPDSYAVFSAQGPGGHNDWSSDTPYDHSSSLLFWDIFDGEGTAAYYDVDYEERTDLATIAALVLRSCLAMHILDVGHTGHGQDPPAIHTPEPAGMLAFLCGAAAVSGFLWRVRRDRHRFH